MLKYFFAWFPMLVIAVINGTLRDLGYKKYTTALAAHQISTLSLIIFFAFYIFFIIRKFPPENPLQAINIGILWVILTLIFEFGFGLYRGNTFNSLLSEYNIFKGKLWILIPLWIAIAPYLFYKLQSDK